MIKEKYTYLALGDSYTIGESLTYNENFPNQTVQLLRKDGYDIEDPEIIAKTGWTTGELTDAIAKTTLHIPYDFVSLLIGVNNQYRGLSPEEYSTQFEKLLMMSKEFAEENHKNVFVISIPDWGATPYADNRDKIKIAAEIDLFNKIAADICTRHQVAFIDITPGSREANNDPSLVAGDQLHPSAKEYAKWAEKLSGAIKKKIREKEKHT